MSFESPSGVPTPPAQDAPPSQGVPPFQGAPQYGAAPYPPYAAPYGGYQAPPAARPSSALPIAVMVLSGVYVLLCLVEIFALNNRVSVANKIINDPTSVTVDQAKSADNLVSAVNGAAIVAFIAMIIVLLVWQRSLRSALAPTGQYQQVLKASGYQMFRVIWLVSIVLAVVLRGSGNLDTPQDVVNHDHQNMVYYGIRAVLMGLLIFFALRLKRTADNVFTAALSQAGYGAGAPVYPQR